ncbi:hypothetical protein GGI35DRAFT_416663 [Trichoderma velutinum]
MSNLDNRHHLPAPDQEPGRSRPIEQLHPILLDIVERIEVIAPEDKASITQTELAQAVWLAISLLPDDEQSYIISRIMTDDEIAEEKLRSPQVQDLQHRVHLSGDEIRLLLRGSPEPEEYGEEDDGEEGCVVCFGNSDVSVPCGCRYCGRCLRENILVGLRSELDFPPGCCDEPFDEATIRLAQRPALVHLFRQLSAEYAVHSGERLYCYDPRCSSFISARAVQPAARDEDDATPVGICPSCDKATCAACGSRSHRGLPCQEDVEDEEALWDMMDDQELVGCPECGIVIALRDGCNHINCVCGAEFCYLCGQCWGDKCSCPQYNGFHLRVPVRQRPGRRPIMRGGRAHPVEDTDDGILRVPQLRYDPEDEVTLAAVDYAPIDASVPTAVPTPASDRVREPILRQNDTEHMEIPLHRNVARPPQHRQHAPAVRPNVLNEDPVGLPPVATFPPFLDEPPLPIPGAFPTPSPPPSPVLPLPPPVHHPIPNHPPDHRFNSRSPELHPLADLDVDAIDHAVRQLRIVVETIEDRHGADRRQRAMTIRDIEREVRQALGPHFVPQRGPQAVQARGHEESEAGEHGRRRRQRRDSR